MEAHDARTAQQIAAAAVLRHAVEGLSTKDEYWSDGLDMEAPVTWHGAMLNRAVRFSQEPITNRKSSIVNVLRQDDAVPIGLI
ncbi:hypothetical protein X970_18230 [Pseudomonas monteilii SB3101]|jgi:hypothetical protein|uniref:Uncharacterized protein n=1 Tax=Pseudomonas monteilii SB3101 TaxID=1435058 RepID=V9V9T4_9PSED|nr:hypothetical protein X969_18595 [Pseudomonas monteilii SB3078]AHC91158.1 hypothetical protein X970_18230 [Pseudomonas monteilii SB3101]